MKKFLKNIKKYTFNRFGLLILGCITIIVFTVLVLYNDSFSEPVTRRDSGRDGDTVYSNELSSDYYYYLGMNYIKDIDNTERNYKHSDLQMVEITYYAYPEDNTSLTGYVSLDTNERQNKFVYYKYYPIENNKIEIQLIENPFMDMPTGMGFNGWTSTDGTISTNSKTNIQTLTADAGGSELKISIYASWAQANVVYIKGSSGGNDNFTGTSVDDAVGGFGRALQLLEQNTTDINNRELNILVLCGNVTSSINYNRPYSTNNYQTSYNFTDGTTFDSTTPVILEHLNGSTRYALKDNNGSVNVEQLNTTGSPADEVKWYIISQDGGYVIKNYSTNRYLAAQGDSETTASLLLSSVPYVWDYNSTNRKFSTDIEYITYSYGMQDPGSVTDGNDYILSSQYSYDTQIGRANNVFRSDFQGGINVTYNRGTNVPNETLGDAYLWKFESYNGGYSIKNVANDSYLGFNSSDNAELSATKTKFDVTTTGNSTKISITSTESQITGFTTTEANLSNSSSSVVIGFSYGGSYRVLYNNNGTLNIVTVTNANYSTIMSDNNYKWNVRSTYIENVGNTNYNIYCGSTPSSIYLSTSTRTWSINGSNVYYRKSGKSYYWNYGGSSLTASTSTSNRCAVRALTFEDHYEDVTVTKYLTYNGGWKATTTVTSLYLFDITRVETDRSTRTYNLYYENWAWKLDSTNYTAVNFATFSLTRTNSSNPTAGTASNNTYYTNTTNIAFTFTSLYNHVDYSTGTNAVTWTMTGGTNIKVTAYNDLQMHHLKVSATGFTSGDEDTAGVNVNVYDNLSTRYATLYANYNNVRIGRGMVPTSWALDNTSVIFAYMEGGNDTSTVSGSDNEFQFTIETGKYAGIMAMRDAHLTSSYSTGLNYKGTIYMTFGNDYDKAMGENTKMATYYRSASNNTAGLVGNQNSNKAAYVMTIKSGDFGNYYFLENIDDADNRYSSGIYVGGLTVSASSSSGDYSPRILIVEGGKIGNINGGLRAYSDKTTYNYTKIYVKGGEVANIVGGAGRSETYGDRYISVTGGSVYYSIAGGSNGISSGSNEGTVSGDTYVHVGGTAKIGTGTKDTLYGAVRGSILGAGNGNSAVADSGKVNNSHVSVSDSAVVYGNVYGGGNYGSVGVSVDIKIDGGTIHGSVYGGANQNGVGTTGTISTTTSSEVVYTDDQEIGSGQYHILYMNGTTRNALTNASGTTISNKTITTTTDPGTSTKWTFNTVSDGYTIQNVSTSNYLTYTESGSSPVLSLSTDTTNGNWKADTENKYFYQDVNYQSTVISYTYNTFTSLLSTDVVITSTNSSTASSLNLNGTTQSMINLDSTEQLTNVWQIIQNGSGYRIKNVNSGYYIVGTYNRGNSSISYTTTASSATTFTATSTGSGTSSYVRFSVTGTNARNRSTTAYLYLNGNTLQLNTNTKNWYVASVNKTNVTVSGRYYLNYNSGWKLTTSSQTLMLATSLSENKTVQTVSSKTNGNVTITMTGGTVKKAVYGGSCSKGNVAGLVTINIKGGTINSDDSGGSVYGGGEGINTNCVNGVSIKIDDSKNNVSIDGNVYGGSAYGNVIGNVTVEVDDDTETDDPKITLKGDTFCGAMGDTSTTSLTGNITGNCTLNVKGGSYTTSFYGGNDSAGSATGNIVVNVGGGTHQIEITMASTDATNGVYGGGNLADSSASSNTVNIDKNSNIDYVFGGGNQAVVKTTTVNLIDGAVVNAFGGGNAAAAETTTVNLKGSTCGTIYGGSNSSGDVTTSNVTTTSGLAINIFGGNNAGGVTSIANVKLNGGEVTNLFGGGQQATTGTTNVSLTNGKATSVYGGGNNAGISGTANVELNGAEVVTIYGGSNANGDVPKTVVNLTSGIATTVFGGNNAGGKTTESDVNIKGAIINNAVYGGGNLVATGTTNVEMTSGQVGVSYDENSSPDSCIFGGGNQAGVDNETIVIINGGKTVCAFGGSNQLGNISVSNVTVKNGTVSGAIYGGNNAGGKTSKTNVTLEGGSTANAYGGGKNATTAETFVTVTGGTNVNVFGGGESAGLELDSSNSNDTGLTAQSHVIVTGGTNTNVFGGSNKSGNVPVSNIELSTSGNTNNVYGGNNIDGETTITNVTVNAGAQADNVYGGGLQAATTTSNVTINNNAGNIANVFGGGSEANVTTSNVTVNSGKITNVFGGSNTSGDVTTANVTIKGAEITNVYGGNNNGGKTITANVLVKDVSVNTVGNVFGGGNNAVTDYPHVEITNSKVNGTVYGGGNNAAITYDTDVVVHNNSTVNTIFGGGNNGEVLGSTDVKIDSATINNNAYAGGNGATAVVYKNTTILVEGTTKIYGSLLGGGNLANTGTSVNLDSSKSIVNIVSGEIGITNTGTESEEKYGNVYGAGYSSVLYGSTKVNIGINEVSKYYTGDDLTEVTNKKGDIHIYGTVFGGGEKDTSSEDSFNFDFICVTNGIEIYIDAANHTNFDIDGSLFGSGNYSSTPSTKTSTIYVNNYGTTSDVKGIKTIQRAKLVVLTNSNIMLDSATDSCNDYGDIQYSLNRVTHLKLRNNTSIYLSKGANLLEEFSSLVYDSDSDTESIATVTIDQEAYSITSRNTNNRLYIKDNSNAVLVISHEQSAVSNFGNVNGMTFFGLYNEATVDGKIQPKTFMYDNINYSSNTNVNRSDLFAFVTGSYVDGLIKVNHNIKVDGFYTYYDYDKSCEDEDDSNNLKIYVDYIDPLNRVTYYRWAIGVEVTNYDISLQASKYSTLGTVEFSLGDFNNANTVFSIAGFNYGDFKDVSYPSRSLSLIDHNSIPKLADTTDIADTVMGLTIKPGTTGWVTTGETNFLTGQASLWNGVTDYKSENSDTPPSLYFYLYHSKNMETEGSMGQVTVSIMASTPLDQYGLSYRVKTIVFTIYMQRVEYDGDYYDAAITPGREYDVFRTAVTTISSKSSFSTYFSLVSNSEDNIYHIDSEGNAVTYDYYRTLVFDRLLPVNTKITMIDLARTDSPEYYYYVVTSEDNNNNNQVLKSYDSGGNLQEAAYKLNKFVRMGSSSTSNKYNETSYNDDYYNAEKNVAYEEFIFIFDFADCGLTEDIEESSVLFELRYDDPDLGNSSSTRFPVLGILRTNMIYNIYTDSDAVVEIEGELSSDNLYLGDQPVLSLTTNFAQELDDNNNTIIDTNFYDKKLGVRLSFEVEDPNNPGTYTTVSGANLFGLTVSYDGVTYSPRSDGSIRINIAERVANVLANVTINTASANLSGNYRVVCESFYSADGVYYGTESSDICYVPFTVLAKQYGLESIISDDDMIIDHEKVTTVGENHYITANIRQESSGKLPRIRIMLYRRSYASVNSTVYTPVELTDYFASFTYTAGDTTFKDKFTNKGTGKEYIVNASSNCDSEFTLRFDFKQNSSGEYVELMTGTYKLEIRLYNNTTYIGEVSNYLIIK